MNAPFLVPTNTRTVLIAWFVFFYDERARAVRTFIHRRRSSMRRFRSDAFELFGERFGTGDRGGARASSAKKRFRLCQDRVLDIGIRQGTFDSGRNHSRRVNPGAPRRAAVKSARAAAGSLLPPTTTRCRGSLRSSALGEQDSLRCRSPGLPQLPARPENASARVPAMLSGASFPV